MVQYDRPIREHETLVISKGSAQYILIKVLVLKKLGARWVPHFLVFIRGVYIRIWWHNLNPFKINETGFMGRFLTRDETLFNHHIPA